MDKLTLAFAAIERLAQASGDTDLVEYLAHSSQHSGDFMEQVTQHHNNLKDMEAFTERHEELTRPEGTKQRTFTQAEFDAAVNAAIKKARA